MIPKQIKLAVTLDNGDLAITSLLLEGRGNKLPAFATWVKDKPGHWEREDSDRVILDELTRAFPDTDHDGTPRPQPTKYRRMSDDEMPADRTYRAAWRDDGKKIVHDMAIARNVHLSLVRRARGPKLDQLDRDWMRANGQGDKKLADTIEKKRQSLRDIPQNLGVEKASTIEELKALKSPLLEE